MKAHGWAIDIDDVLADTAWSVMEAMYQQGHQLASDLSVVRQTYNQPGDVVEWQSPQARQVIRSLFNDPDFLINLQPIEHAQKLVSSQVKPRLYISSRDKSLQTVTEVWLTKHQFPKAPVILRHELVRSSNWKIQYLHQNRIPVRGLIDDSLAAFMDSNYFQGKKIWFNRGSTSTPGKSVLVAKDWPEVSFLTQT